jgi:DNA-binding NtrC family response regulator
VADPAHILVFYEDPVIGESLLTYLASEGFKVTGAKTPLEAAWCLADGRVNLFLIHFPDTEWIVNAILIEVRRAYPTMPIVALAPTISKGVGQLLVRLDISKVLPARKSWQGLAETIHQALGSSAPVHGAEDR